MLGGDTGVVVEKENEIREFFTSSGPRSWGNSLDHMNHVITNEMNFELCKSVLLEEVKEPVFQLGTLRRQVLMVFLGFSIISTRRS